MSLAIMNNILDVVLENMEIILFAWGILQVKMVKEKKAYVCSAFVFALSEVVYIFCPNKDIGYGFGIILGQMLAVIIFFQGKIWERLAKYWFSLFYVDALYFPVKVITDICMFPLREQKIVLSVKDKLITILTIVLILLCSRQIKKRKEWVAWIRSIPLRYYCLGILCSFCVVFVGAFINYIKVEENSAVRIILEIMRVIISTFLYILGIAFAFVNLWRIQYKRENSLKDDYLRMSKMYYQKLVVHMQEVRSMKHDMQAHLNLLENFIREEKWEQAEAYLQEIKVQQSWNREQIINVGHELVSAVLTEYVHQSADIKFSCEGVLPEQLLISDFDLCTIFSNLMSNSIENCQKLKGQEKWIHMQIKVFQKNLFIVLENPLTEEVDIKKLGQFTSKEDKENHGYGILNVKKTVEKYDGEIEFMTNDGKFQVKMIFYQAIKE